MSGSIDRISGSSVRERQLGLADPSAKLHDPKCTQIESLRKAGRHIHRPKAVIQHESSSNRVLVEYQRKSNKRKKYSSLKLHVR